VDQWHWWRIAACREIHEMNTRVADRLVLRALSTAEHGLSLPALHGRVALDPDSDALDAFVAEISSALVRLLMSGDVSVEREDGRVVYHARCLQAEHPAVA
jgi:hypothetical protein